MRPIPVLASQDLEIALQEWPVRENAEIVVPQGKNEPEPEGTEGGPRFTHEVRQLNGMQGRWEIPLGL